MDVGHARVEPFSAGLKTHRDWLRLGGAAGWQITSQEEFDEDPSDRDVAQTDMERELLEDLGPAARLAADPSIPFEYILDGCYARAHKMCDTMHSDSMNCAKMFVPGDDCGDPDGILRRVGPYKETVVPRAPRRVSRSGRLSAPRYPAGPRPGRAKLRGI